MRYASAFNSSKQESALNDSKTFTVPFIKDGVTRMVV